MKAVVMRGHTLVVEELADPAPGPLDALVRTVACGICGSDLHFLHHGHRMIELSESAGTVSKVDPGRDLVMGHEFVAEVLELGAAAQTSAKVGDLVVSMPIHLGSFPPTPETVNAIGYSNSINGGYAEQMLLSSPLLLVVPNGLDPAHAALTEPIAVGLHAVNMSGIVRGDWALIHGCGPVGLAVIAALKRLGVETILAGDFSPARRALALTYGASEVVDPAVETVIDAWTRVTGGPKAMTSYLAGSGSGVVQFECVGVKGMINENMRRAPKGSAITVVGVCMDSDTITPILGINKELRMQFVLGYTPDEFADSLRALAEGDIPGDPIITGRVGLDGVAAAFEDLGHPDRHAKILVTPGI
jgi:threonine dehydrogenase-like Zn-dependent dehydrogenase